MSTKLNNRTPKSSKSSKLNTRNPKNSKSSKGSKSSQQERPVYDYEIKVRRVFDGQYGVLFDLELNHVTIYGCRVCHTADDRPFVGFPQKKGKDGQYWGHAYAPLTDEQTDEIMDQVADMLEQGDEDDEEEIPFD